MASARQLDLNSVTIDVPLAQRVPYALSRYYLALPLGQDNGSVSVAMAYPDNIKARQVLSRLLQAQIVPVFTPVERLLPVLERIYCPENQQRRAILAWYKQPEWETAVMTATSMFNDTRHVSAIAYSSTDLSLDELLSLAATSQYELVVMPAPAPSLLATVLNRATIPLFFVRGEQPTIRHILVVIRGFASDERALDWLTPLACQQQAAITLMPLINGSGSHWHPYHHQDSPAGQHLERCLGRLQAKGIAVNLKYQFGNAIQQVVNEVSGDAYDLLVLAAEAKGDFANQVITAVDQDNAHRNRAIFVLKPPELPYQSAIKSLEEGE